MNDNQPARVMRVTFPNLLIEQEEDCRVYMVETDQGDIFPCRIGDSLTLKAGPEYDYMMVCEIRHRSTEYRTAILRPETIKGWLKEFWKWYMGK